MKFPPKSILVPFDFSDCSRAGLEAAKLLSLRWASRLELVYVNQGPPASLCQNDGAPKDAARLRRYQERLEASLHKPLSGLPKFAAHVLEGDPGDILSRLAADGKSDLVVMGSHGRKGISRFIMGSIAESVVHGSASPILTVHSKPGADWPRKMLVPMKFTDYADKALLYALEWARSLEASLSIVHVCESPEGEKEANTALEGHLEQLLGGRSREVCRILYCGQPVQNILKAATAGNFDLIVLSPHLKPFLTDMILGTTAERVLRHSRVPVLAVPSAARQQNPDPLFWGLDKEPFWEQKRYLLT